MSCRTILMVILGAPPCVGEVGARRARAVLLHTLRAPKSHELHRLRGAEAISAYAAKDNEIVVFNELKPTTAVGAHTGGESNPEFQVLALDLQLDGAGMLINPGSCIIVLSFRQGLSAHPEAMLIRSRSPQKSGSAFTSALGEFGATEPWEHYDAGFVAPMNLQPNVRADAAVDP
ncbi:hypothetical protein C8R46DRAFT_1034712 [Mycena filopes]|nr:hypothetical protein C8R46DRAFT_1034712 [Mycena filopes]